MSRTRVTGPTVLESIADRWHAAREVAREYPALARFRRFYEALDDKRDIFYVFFTSGMLMWVRKCLSFVPAGVNLVLIGSGLSDEEEAYLRSRATAPLFVTRACIDDKSCWRWLFEVNRFHFGWLDVDCLVLHPGLFDELREMAPGTSFNTIWSYEVPNHIRLLSTFFLFVNVDVIDAMRDPRVRVSPVTHTVHPSRDGRHAKGAWSRVLTRRQAAWLRQIWPCDAGGTLQVPYEGYWDTLKVYQLIAQLNGFGIRRVRDLQGVFPQPDSYSHEVIHIGAASHLKRETWDRVLHVSPQVYALHLQFRCALLREALDVLPAAYGQLYGEWMREMQQLGLSEAGIGQNLRRFFGSMGLTEELFQGERWAFMAT